MIFSIFLFLDGTEYFFTGATYILGENVWKWSTSMEPLTWFTWIPGEPNRVGTEFCICQKDKLWYDCPSVNFQLPFVCEKGIN